ncbi:MAG: class I SAM-dependent methyltransferase, partial [bacterium]|nr:class I SAM-dependent methyltransferase [bacterium]
LSEQELWDKYGKLQKEEGVTLGAHSSYQLKNTPRRILFSLSRYKFAAKLIGDEKKILELGCSDGLGTYLLAEFNREVVGVDFDGEVVQWTRENFEKNNVRFICDNFLGKEYGTFDAVVAFDVIEHIYQRNEKEFMQTLNRNLAVDGIAVIGTPNITSQKYSSKVVNDAHVNMYSAERLQKSMNEYFNNVFMFGANDEVIHTGFPAMTQYLIAVGCYKKK